MPSLRYERSWIEDGRRLLTSPFRTFRFRRHRTFPTLLTHNMQDSMHA